MPVLGYRPPKQIRGTCCSVLCLLVCWDEPDTYISQIRWLIADVVSYLSHHQHSGKLNSTIATIAEGREPTGWLKLILAPRRFERKGRGMQFQDTNAPWKRQLGYMVAAIVGTSAIAYKADKTTHRVVQ